MTKPSETPSLMDDREFLAELEQIDRHSPLAPRPDVGAEAAWPIEYATSAGAATDEDALDAADLFKPSPLQPGTAVFADDDEPEYEPLPPITQATGSLVPAVLIGMAVGGGAAALVFHERLVRLLFGG